MKDLWLLFWAFVRIGAFTFGGGYAMLPMLQKEIVDKYHWSTEEEIIDFFAIGQCTPGVIAVNTATFIGYKNKGIIGAVTATLGLILPSLVIIMSIAAVLSNFSQLPIVQHAFAGICIIVAVLIINVVISMLKKAVIDYYSFFIFMGTLLIGFIFDFSPVYIVALAALLGILIRFRGGAKKS